jgi:hypothetical protein
VEAPFSAAFSQVLGIDPYSFLRPTFDNMDRITTVRSPGLVHFYDVLWNVYRFLGTPTIQRDNLAQCIQLTLLKQAFDEEEDTSRRKELSECTVDPISLQLGTSTFSGVAVCAEFKTGQPFRFIHYSSQAKEVSLLLVKGNLGGLGQSLTESFFEMIGISSYQTLKLPTSLLSSQLELYLEGLVPYAPTRDLEPFIHNAVGKLNVTVAAEAPVAPNLKSLDIGVPATDVWTWLSSSPQQGKFLARLTQCLQSMTGMKLDLGSSRGIYNHHKSRFTS